LIQQAGDWRLEAGDWRLKRNSGIFIVDKKY
jgi:hypothetical protein